MITVCNFRSKRTFSNKPGDHCVLTEYATASGGSGMVHSSTDRKLCFGEDNCILFQTYKLVASKL